MCLTTTCIVSAVLAQGYNNVLLTNVKETTLQVKKMSQEILTQVENTQFHTKAKLHGSDDYITSHLNIFLNKSNMMWNVDLQNIYVESFQ